MSFHVQATKKGGVALSLQKTKWGKVVTRVERVGGDRDALCTALKTRLGTGGTVADDGCVEVQGDHREAVTEWLLSTGVVRGAAKPKPAPAEADAADDEPAERRKPRHEKQAAALGGLTAEEADAAAARAAGDGRAAKRGVATGGGASVGVRRLRRADAQLGVLGARLRDAAAAVRAVRGAARGGAAEGGGASAGPPASAAAAVAVPAGGGGSALDRALRSLGMLAEPCPTRQTRAERQRVKAGKPPQPQPRAAAPARAVSGGGAPRVDATPRSALCGCAWRRRRMGGGASGGRGGCAVAGAASMPAQSLVPGGRARAGGWTPPRRHRTSTRAWASARPAAVGAAAAAVAAAAARQR